jgi:hypothetical protein
MPNRPTLLSSCASAATAKEAAFRIDAGPRIPRAARVVALDAGAGEVIRPLTAEQWPGARFLTYETGRNPDAALDDLVLGTAGGSSERLGDVLDGADFVMMVATAGDGAPAASAIGMACTLRGITTAGLIVGTSGNADAAVQALRPHARVLLISQDGADVADVLAAVGA